jgi:hypothetical protein
VHARARSASDISQRARLVSVWEDVSSSSSSLVSVAIAPPPPAAPKESCADPAPLVMQRFIRCTGAASARAGAGAGLLIPAIDPAKKA